MIAQQQFKLLPIFTGIFVACLLISNVAAQKIIAIGPLTLPGTTLIFPLSFIFGDILTEVYGYAQSRKVIWTGLACVVLAALMYAVIGALPAASFWENQEAYDAILGVSLRVALASVCAYFTGEFCNSFVLSRMKYRAHGQRGLSQAWRFILSTIVGEGVDTVVFMTIAFAGVFATEELLWTIFSLYLFKVAYEVILTPISTRFADWVKKVEVVDMIDDPQNTDYNPFTIAQHERTSV